MWTPRQESPRDNTAALAWLDAWYATPDATPPEWWGAFEAFLEAHPIRFRAWEDDEG